MRLATPHVRHPLFTALLCIAGLCLTAEISPAQNPKAAKTKPSAAKKTPSKPAAQTELSKHVAANIKFLNVLSRYADALNAATDAATANLAAAQIEVITKDAIIAGEELAKLGRPTPELEAKIATDKEVTAAAAKVAANTQTAVAAIAANEEIKTVMAPSIESFQAALNRIQQFADDPQSAAAPGQPAAAESTAASKPAGGPTVK